MGSPCSFLSWGMQLSLPRDKACWMTDPTPTPCLNGSVMLQSMILFAATSELQDQNPSQMGLQVRPTLAGLCLNIVSLIADSQFYQSGWLQCLAPYDNVWSQISGGNHRKKIVGEVREISSHLERIREVHHCASGKISLTFLLCSKLSRIGQCWRPGIEANKM